MKISIARITAVLAAGALVMCSAVSCGDGKKNSSSGNNLVGGDNVKSGMNAAESDLPYGAKMTQLRPERDERITVFTEFDNRYFTRTEEGSYPQIYPIHDYINAVNERSADIMKEAFYPALLEKYCKEAGHEDNIQEYVDSYADSIKKALNEDFTFDYIIVQACTVADPDNLDADFKDLDAELESIEPGITEKITDRRIVDLDLYYNVNGQNEKSYTTHTGDSIILYEYEIDGRYYIV